MEKVGQTLGGGELEDLGLEAAFSGRSSPSHQRCLSLLHKTHSAFRFRFQRELRQSDSEEAQLLHDLDESGIV